MIPAPPPSLLPFSIRQGSEPLSVNPVVGETNDGYLNDIRGHHITPDDVLAAIKHAKSGPVEEAMSAPAPELQPGKPIGTKWVFTLQPTAGAFLPAPFTPSGPARTIFSTA